MITPQRPSHRARAVRAVAALAAVIVVGASGVTAAVASVPDDAGEDVVAHVSAVPQDETPAPVQDESPVLVEDEEVGPIEQQGPPLVEDEAPAPGEGGESAPVEGPAPVVGAGAPAVEQDVVAVQDQANVMEVGSAGTSGTVESADVGQEPGTMPTDVTAKVVDGRLTVTWTHVGGLVIIGLVGNTWWTWSSDGQVGTFTTQWGFSPGEYTAYVEDFQTKERATASFTVTPPVYAPSPPGDVAGAQTGDGEVTVSWTAPQWDGNSPVTGYEVVVDDFTPVVVGPDVNETTRSGVARGVHDIAVKALNIKGSSGASTTQVELVAAPSAPRDVTVTPGPTLGDVTVTWQAPADAGHPGVGGYVVTLDREGAQDRFTGSSTLEYTFEGLAPGSYEVAVLADSEAGTSGPATATFEVRAPVQAPTDVVGVQVGPQSVRVTWVDDSDDDRITGYEVVGVPTTVVSGLSTRSGALAGGSVPGTVSAEVGAEDRAVTLGGLQEGTSYVFTVTPLTADGTGPSGTGSAPTVEEWRVPSGVRDATVVQTGPRQITIRFSAPADQGTSAILRYVVGLSSPQSAGYQPFSADTREVVIDDLDPLTYALGITPENSQGSGPRVDLGITVDADWSAPVPDPDLDVAPDADADAGPVVLARVTSAAPGQAALATTGAEAGTLAALGLLLVGAGAAVVTATRRRTA